MNINSAVRSVSIAAALMVMSAARGAEPPTAWKPGDLVTDYHGLKVADPYRALEATTAPETVAWASAQQARTREVLDSLPGLAALKARISVLDSERSSVLVDATVLRGGRWFYLKRPPGANLTKLYSRESLGGPERVLFDPEVWRRRDGVAYSINNFSVAPDGKHVAAVISKADAELGELYVFDSSSGKAVLDSVPAIWGELVAMWRANSRSFFYARGADAHKSGGQPFGKFQVFERFLGGAPDRKVAGWGEPGSSLAVREKDWVWIDASSSRKHALAFQYEGIGSNARVAVTSNRDLTKRGGAATWVPLLDSDADVISASVVGDFLYARTFKQAPRYRVLRFDLRHPRAAPTHLIEQANVGVLDAMVAAADGLYYVVRMGSVSEMYRVKHGAQASTAERISLPFVGSVKLLDGRSDVAGVVFSLEGWTRELQVYRAIGNQVMRTPLVEVSRVPIGLDWVAEEQTCTSHDGVEVPMSVIYRRGLEKDGSRPVLMDGYGGYGRAERAYFNRRMDPWLQRGGVFVEVKPRGGGAHGRDWYQAGVGAKKANTWKDMIACAEALIARGFTTKSKLAVQGTSMGGVAAGRAITERPDLFAVGIVRVGITDTVRFIEATSNGPNHENEMGSVKSESGVRQLLAMSTYAQIREATRYPAMLFTAGMNDNRVAPWLAFKTFARMSAATTGAGPVLLRVETDSGHGVSADAEQRNAELADRLAFVLWITGDADFQPR